MDKRISLVAVLAVFFGYLLIGCAEVPMAQMSQLKGGGETAILTPLPKNIKIIPPAADIPKEIAAFSGIWQGAWNEKLSTVLVVEEIVPPDVKGIYAVGPFGGKDGGWAYFEGKIESGKLAFALLGRSYSYTLVDGELHGVWRMFAPDNKTATLLSKAVLKKRQG